MQWADVLAALPIALWRARAGDRMLWVEDFRHLWVLLGLVAARGGTRLAL